MNIFKSVTAFHKHHSLHWHRKKPGVLSSYLYLSRIRFLCEEIREFDDAHKARDIEGCLDGMIDLIYVASGTLHLMGFSASRQAEAFKRVHKANMKKVKVRSVKESKRGTLWDVKKPQGWKAPDLRDLCL